MLGNLTDFIKLGTRSFHGDISCSACTTMRNNPVYNKPAVKSSEGASADISSLAVCHDSHPYHHNVCAGESFYC